MADFKVDPPPISGPISDGNGNPTPFFRSFLRDLWRRTSDPRGNAIETASQLAAQAKLVGDSALEAADSVSGAADDAVELAGTAGETAVLAAEAIVDHRESEAAHGSNGNIVGFDDLAGPAQPGLVQQAAAQADASATTTAALSAVSASYTQAEVQAIVDGFNTLRGEHNELVTAHNNLLQALQDAGIMA